MGKKKNSKSNLSANPDDHTEADQASTSSRDSSVLLDPTPPFVFPTEPLTSADNPAAFQQELLQLLNGITDRLRSIEDRLSTLENSNLIESRPHISSVPDSDLPLKPQSSFETTIFNSHYRFIENFASPSILDFGETTSLRNKCSPTYF